MARQGGLYTPEQRLRRDTTRWTLVQGILAPVQFAIFFVSLCLVVRYLWTGEGESAAAVSVLIKTLTLYLIMVTGCIWEKVVFGQYLFAPAFFMEDMVSMVVLALHAAYVCALFYSYGTPRQQMLLALTAYVAYVVNAAQYIVKMRMARLQSSPELVGAV